MWNFAKKCENVKFVKFVKICEILSKKWSETLLIKGWLTSEFKKKSLFFTFEPKNPVTLSPKFRGRPSFWVKFFAVATFLDPLFSLFHKISQLFTNFTISRKRTFWQNFTLFTLFDNFTKNGPPQIWQLSGFFEKFSVQIEIGVRVVVEFRLNAQQDDIGRVATLTRLLKCPVAFQEFWEWRSTGTKWRRSKSRNLVPSAKRCQVAMTGVGHNLMIACRVSPCAWQLVPATILIHRQSTSDPQKRSLFTRCSSHLTLAARSTCPRRGTP